MIYLEKNKKIILNLTKKIQKFKIKILFTLYRIFFLFIFVIIFLFIFNSFSFFF